MHHTTKTKMNFKFIGENRYGKKPSVPSRH